MGMCVQSHTPACLPPGNTRYELHRRLGGPQGRSGRVRKISHTPGFGPRTFQPVPFRYTDWAIPAFSYWHNWNLSFLIQESERKPRETKTVILCRYSLLSFFLFLFINTFNFMLNIICCLEKHWNFFWNRLFSSYQLNAHFVYSIKIYVTL